IHRSLLCPSTQASTAPVAVASSRLVASSSLIGDRPSLVAVQMAPSRRMVASVFLLLAILVATEMGTTQVAEARHCLSQSHRFKGMCVSSNNCANVCKTENFPDGECKSHGLERKCFCKKLC
uniref:Knottins-like domain-containing protein n=2 Tax=Oryza brachyantha TaxID=4533 RepID=J3LF03_ORYBR